MYDFSAAKVFLFDPVRQNLRITGYTLNEIGFRNVTSFSEYSEFEKSLNEIAPSLIVAEMTEHTDEVTKLVKDIRKSDWGMDPFSSIILTLWKRDAGLIKRGIASGADDVLLRPFSTHFVKERVKIQIRSRKPFVVISDYVGPDRREDTQRDSAVEVIEVPNMLKAVAENDEDAIKRNVSLFNEAGVRVRKERLRRICMRVAIGAEVGLSELKSGRYPQIDPSEFKACADEIHQQLLHYQERHAMQFARTFNELSVSLNEPEGLTLAHLNKAREMAIAIHTTFTGEDDAQLPTDEISKMALMIKQGLAKRRDLAKIQQQSVSSAAPLADVKIINS